MKKIKANRFTKKRPEEISFKGSAILDNPKKKTGSKKAQKSQKTKKDRSTVRPNHRPNESTKHINVFRYQIEVPEVRRKVRHTFDIFEDQMATLEKFQLAISDQEGTKPFIGDMIQQAIDLFTKQQIKKLKNVELISHNTKAFDRSTDRTNNRTNK